MNYFDARIIGGSLVEASRDTIQTEQAQVQSFWYHSDADADVFLWKEDQQKGLLKFQIIVFGQVVEWNALEGVKTGAIMEREHEGAPASEEILFDSRPAPLALAQATELLLHMSFLTDQERQEMQQSLQESPQQFLQRQEEIMMQLRYDFGPERATSGLKSVLQRLKKWF